MLHVPPSYPHMDKNKGGVSSSVLSHDSGLHKWIHSWTVRILWLEVT